MSVLHLFRVTPEQPIGVDGRMSLGDHFRELRGRLLRSLLVLLATTIAAFFFYPQLIDLIVGPYNHAVDLLGGKEQANSEIVLSGIASGLMLQLKLCATAGVLASSPYWLYQIWAFMLPGLHTDERKWTKSLRQRRRSIVLPRHHRRVLHHAQGPAVPDLDEHAGRVPEPQ